MELDDQFKQLDSLLERLRTKQQEAIDKADKLLADIREPKSETQEKKEINND